MTTNLLTALTDNILVDPAKCVFCGECIEVCVLDNLRMKLAPCRAACPLGVNCQGYIQLIARGDDNKAFEVLSKTLPFPGIMARVCTAPCESACHRKEKTGQAVAIRALKRFLADFAGKDRAFPELAPDSGKKIAVAGSGPAGMMAAFELLKRGHDVTIFESESEPGGMLRWAIPEFNLPSRVVDEEFGLLRQMGVTIECGVRVGEQKSLASLKEKFDAVVIAVGCGGHAKLGIEGEDLAGVYHGLPLLKAARSDEAPELSGPAVIIGGGNVAVDAARTALRLGAREVRVICLEAEGELPALREIVETAAAEGVVFDYGWGPVRIEGRDGKVAAVELQRCLAVLDEAGRFCPRFDSGETKTVGADSVIVAIGQKADAACLQGSGIQGPLDPLTLATSDDKIFMAGDFVSGPSAVVEAMASGRVAAESAHRFVLGEDLKYGRAYAGPVELDFDIDTSKASEQDRVKPTLKPCQGKGDFNEVAGPITQDQARAEASRCYSCGLPFGKHRTCWFCLPCEVECPEDALYVEIPYLLR